MPSLANAAASRLDPRGGILVGLAVITKDDDLLVGDDGGGDGQEIRGVHERLRCLKRLTRGRGVVWTCANRR